MSLNLWRVRKLALRNKELFYVQVAYVNLPLDLTYRRGVVALAYPGVLYPEVVLSLR